MTRDFRERDLIVNRRVEEYDGTTAVTRSAHLDAEEIEFMRWKAERWMKVRHMPTVVRHDPGFVLRNGRAHARAHVPRHDVALGARPRGATATRSAATARSGSGERDYIDWPDPHPQSSDLDVQDAAARPHVPVVVRAG